MPVPTLSRNAFVGLPWDQQWFHVVHAFNEADPLTLSKFDLLNESEKRFELYRILKSGGVGGNQSFAGQPLQALDGAVMPNNGYFNQNFTIRADQWQVGKAIELGYFLDFELNNHPSSIDTRIDLGVSQAINLITVSTVDFNNQPSNLIPITMQVDLRLTPFSGVGTTNMFINVTGTMMMTGTAHFDPPKIFSLNQTRQFVDSTVDNLIRFRVLNETNTNALDTVRLFSEYIRF